MRALTATAIRRVARGSLLSAVALVGELLLRPLSTSASRARSPGAARIFGSPQTVLTLPADAVGAATEMATGDLNGDGLVDVVVTRITIRRRTSRTRSGSSSPTGTVASPTVQ
jgi:hypothetical protein